MTISDLAAVAFGALGSLLAVGTATIAWARRGGALSTRVDSLCDKVAELDADIKRLDRRVDEHDTATAVIQSDIAAMGRSLTGISDKLDALSAFLMREGSRSD